MVNAARNAYMNGMVTTASPARLLIMLFERLQLDIERAAEAQRDERYADASPHLLHAQEIVLELQSSLKVDVWEGGPGLAALYSFLHSQLVAANIKRDLAITESCLTLVVPLVDAWRQAALTAAAS